MRLLRLSLKNWMNFRELQHVEFGDVSYVIGPNAVGKSNLLDALRFLRDVALPAGRKPGSGGLQEAVVRRGGLSKIRCLNARGDTEVRIEITLEDKESGKWKYALGFKGEGQGNNRIVVSHETVELNGKPMGSPRPDKEDEGDRELLTRTRLETPRDNKDFRGIAHFLGDITYLHLVPQLLRYSEEIGGRTLQRDPFGQGFLLRIAETQVKTRNSRLRRIAKTLSNVVTQFEDIRFVQDEVSGQPHIEANFRHWRDNGAWQRESQLSDGTLRLIGLLWSLLEGDSFLLLEEPELSLNEEIVRHLPKLIRTVLNSSKSESRQVVLTTHSEALLSDSSIGAESIIRLRADKNGTQLDPPTSEEEIMLKSGFPVGASLLPSTKPKGAGEMLFEFAR
jgi:predicted ATPase